MTRDPDHEGYHEREAMRGTIITSRRANVADIQIYGLGLCCASVCAPEGMSREVVEAEVNRAQPAGGDLRWAVSADKTFKDGTSPNPCPCDQVSGRLHYLLNC